MPTDWRAQFLARMAIPPFLSQLPGDEELYFVRIDLVEPVGNSEWSLAGLNSWHTQSVELGTRYRWRWICPNEKHRFRRDVLSLIVETRQNTFVMG